MFFRKRQSNGNQANMEEQLYSALRQVEDPDLKKDLVTLGMIKDLKIEGSDIYFTIELTTPACPLKDKLKNDCIEAITQTIGEGYSINRLLPKGTPTPKTLQGSRTSLRFRQGKVVSGNQLWQPTSP